MTEVTEGLQTVQSAPTLAPDAETPVARLKVAFRPPLNLESRFLEKRVGGDSLERRILIPSLQLSREDGMGKPYSMDLRERVVAAIESGLSTRQKAARFAIGIAIAGTWARCGQRGRFALPNRATRKVPCLMGTRLSSWARLQRRLTRRLTRWSSGCGRNAPSRL
jgi:hypothetical protein